MRTKTIYDDILTERDGVLLFALPYAAEENGVAEELASHYGINFAAEELKTALLADGDVLALDVSERLTVVGGRFPKSFTRDVFQQERGFSCFYRAAEIASQKNKPLFFPRIWGMNEAEWSDFLLKIEQRIDSSVELFLIEIPPIPPYHRKTFVIPSSKSIDYSSSQRDFLAEE